MEENSITFNDMPTIMATLLTQVQELHTKMDNLNLIVLDQQEEKKDKILSIQEVSKMVHKSTSTVYKMVSRNEIPCYKQGKTVTFMESEILEWMKQYKRGSTKQMMALAEQYLQRLQ